MEGGGKVEAGGPREVAPNSTHPQADPWEQWIKEPSGRTREYEGIVPACPGRVEVGGGDARVRCLCAVTEEARDEP